MNGALNSRFMAVSQAACFVGLAVPAQLLSHPAVVRVRRTEIWNAITSQRNCTVVRSLTSESSHAAEPQFSHEQDVGSRETSEQGQEELCFPGEKLVVYSKPGCCLCDGLKEKLQLALASSTTPILQGLTIEVRDITTRPEWESAYQYEIPVMTRLTVAGTEFPIARQSPRVTVARLQQHLASAFGK